MRSRVSEPRQAVIVQRGEIPDSARPSTCFSLPDLRAKLSDQDAPAKAGSCNHSRRSVQQHFANVSVKLNGAASHQHSCNSSKANLNIASELFSRKTQQQSLLLAFLRFDLLNH
jgi:hypothetical protein